MINISFPKITKSEVKESTKNSKLHLKILELEDKINKLSFGLKEEKEEDEEFDEEFDEEMPEIPGIPTFDSTAGDSSDENNNLNANIHITTFDPPGTSNKNKRVKIWTNGKLCISVTPNGPAVGMFIKAQFPNCGKCPGAPVQGCVLPKPLSLLMFFSRIAAIAYGNGEVPTNFKTETQRFFDIVIKYLENKSKEFFEGYVDFWKNVAAEGIDKVLSTVENEVQAFSEVYEILEVDDSANSIRNKANSVADKIEQKLSNPDLFKTEKAVYKKAKKYFKKWAQ